MALTYITKQGYPVLSSKFNSQNVTYVDVYADDVTKQLVFIDEKTGNELYRIPSFSNEFFYFEANLTQSGVNAPSIKVFSNTFSLGPITTSYVGIGKYDIDFGTLVPTSLDKTRLVVTIGVGRLKFPFMATFEPIGATTARIETLYAGPGGEAQIDGRLYNSALQIKYYP